MELYNLASTGIAGLDDTIDHLRLGDNVVWQVDSADDFAEVVHPFVDRALRDGRAVHYIRFGSQKAVLDHTPGVIVHLMDPSAGFENFAARVHDLIGSLGATAYYVIDPLSELLDIWHSDWMVMNFFKVTCPYLYDLDTVAYFALLRGKHSTTTIAGIRETTQLLLELHRIDSSLYVHPLKVWSRYSPTMFFPHRIDGDDLTPVTSSEEAGRLFASLGGRVQRRDHWADVVEWTRERVGRGVEDERHARNLLIDVMVGREGRLVELCRVHFTLLDMLTIADRHVGTGQIGGKSVGMLVARAILNHDQQGRFSARLEAHDSFYLGSDVFYTYVVANGWWRLRMRQQADEEYFSVGAQLHDLLGGGSFPPSLREEFWRVLDHFGQSPIIVRSSSLLEDNFGNAFAGKYDSIFLVNRGTPEERYRAFEDAVRKVYASSMSFEALTYRRERGLEHMDEQMAVLVQRVSGDQHDDIFFPHAAGVGNSSNLYSWSPDIDPEAGMLRLVVGLGTRAVDRTKTDYARIVALDAPDAWWGAERENLGRWTQKRMDVLSLDEGQMMAIPVASMTTKDVRADWSLFVTPDEEAATRLSELGRDPAGAPRIVDFSGLIHRTDFTSFMRQMLDALESAYGYPVDTEFTINVNRRGEIRVNLLQCRPLQTRGIGRAVNVIEPADPTDCLLTTRGSFMGGNATMPISHVVAVNPRAYLSLGTQDRHQVGRLIGQVNRVLADQTVMYIGPGRWGTTTPSLGVPVSFSDISHAAVLVEFTYAPGGFLPELSWGSHFFQDLVETGIFYVALLDEAPGTIYNPEWVTDRPNVLVDLVPEAAPLADVLHVAEYGGVGKGPVWWRKRMREGNPTLELRADVVSQRLVVR